MPQTSLFLIALSTVVAAAEAVPKPAAIAQDTIGLITQHRPTSADGKPGIFRMQGEVSGGLVLARGSVDDTLTGSAAFWLPVVDGNMAIRFGADVLRYDIGDHLDLGLGDLGIRWDWAPTMAGPNALLVEVDTTWDTATRDRLGANTNTIAPGAVYVIETGRNFTFAPGIDHRLDWGSNEGQDISLTRIHGYFGWPGDGRFWALGDPNLNLDSENDRTWVALEAEGGVNLGQKLSAWVRPSIPLGDERPYDLKLTGGLDLVF